MKVVGSREFQISYQRLVEPVKVVAKRGSKVERVIGRFFPGDEPPKEDVEVKRGAG